MISSKIDKGQKAKNSRNKISTDVFGSIAFISIYTSCVWKV